MRAALLLVAGCGASAPAVVDNRDATTAPPRQFSVELCVSEGAQDQPRCTGVSAWSLGARAAHGSLAITDQEASPQVHFAFEGPIDPANDGVPTRMARVGGGAPLGLHCAPTTVSVHRRGALGHPLCFPDAKQDWPDTPSPVRVTMCVADSTSKPPVVVDTIVFADPPVDDVRIACCAPNGVCNEYRAYRFADP